MTLLLFFINKFVEVFFSVFPSVALCGDRVLSTVRNDFPRLSVCTSWRDVWSMMPQRPDIHRRCDIGVFTMSGQERTLRVWMHLVRTEDIEDHHRHEGGFYRRYRYRDLSNMNPLVFQFIMYIYIYVFVLYKILKLTKNLVFFWSSQKGSWQGTFHSWYIHSWNLTASFLSSIWPRNPRALADYWVPWQVNGPVREYHVCIYSLNVVSTVIRGSLDCYLHFYFLMFTKCHL